jgi:transposase
MDNRRSYPSDLSKPEWAQVERFIPPPKPGGRPAEPDPKDIVDALLDVARTGCQGRALPHDFPPWGTVYRSFRTWKADGTLDRRRDARRGDRRAAAGRHRQPSAAIIDSRSVKTTEKGGSAATMVARRSPGGRGPSWSTRSA